MAMYVYNTVFCVKVMQVYGVSEIVATQILPRPVLYNNVISGNAIVI